MRELIESLFKKSIELGDVQYTEVEIENSWIGNDPATSKQIKDAESKLSVSFPDDYKELLSITNGFKTSNYNVFTSFMKIEEVAYFKEVIPHAIEAYEDTLPELNEAIIIAGANETQQFLLVPPVKSRPEWRYWAFANWHPGEEEYNGLEDYLKNTIDSIQSFIDNKD